MPANPKTINVCLVGQKFMGRTHSNAFLTVGKFFDVPILLGHIRSGRLKALAITSAKRAEALAEVPTTAEGGYPNVTSDNWYGLVMPAATPPEIQKRVHAAAVAALQSPGLKEQYAKVSGVPSPSTPQEYAAFLEGEQAKWSRIVSAIGFKEQN